MQGHHYQHGEARAGGWEGTCLSPCFCGQLLLVGSSVLNLGTDIGHVDFLEKVHGLAERPYIIAGLHFDQVSPRAAGSVGALEGLLGLGLGTGEAEVASLGLFPGRSPGRACHRGLPHTGRRPTRDCWEGARPHSHPSPPLRSLADPTLFWL